MKKFGFICMVIVLALGTLGVAYAMWSETLVIGSQVDTGELSAEWRLCAKTDKGLDPIYPFDPAYVPEEKEDWGKDVGNVTCSIDPENKRILRITINNGYPCYYNDCQVEFQNTGSIPFIVESINVTPVSPADFNFASGYGVNDGEVWVLWADGVGTQVELDDPETLNIDESILGSSLHIHVEQCASENATYVFEIEAFLVQWNESEHLD